MTYRISDRIKEVSTEENAAQYARAESKSQFCLGLLGIPASHPGLDHWIGKLADTFDKMNGTQSTRVTGVMKGTTDASYMLKQCQSTGSFWAETEVKWDRKFGKCDRRTMRKHNSVYTRSALKQWGKRNNVDIDPADLERLPKAI